MKMKTLLAASLLVPGLALADISPPSPVYTPTRVVQPGYVNAMEGPYGKIEAGAFWPNKVKFGGAVSGSAKGKSSFSVGLGGGYIFNDFARTDLMLNYRDLRVKQFGRGNVWSAMWNGYLDAHNSTSFTPFALAGIGLGYVQPKPSLAGFKGANAAITSAKGKNSTNFIWNIGAGIAAKVDDGVCVDVTYRYIDTGKIKVNTNVGNANSKNVRANEVVLGLGYRF
jgi:opacity protein-like surface antigen